MTPEQRAAYLREIAAEKAIADRERAAGHFNPPRRGIADLSTPPRWRHVLRVALCTAALLGAAALGKWLGS